MDLLFRISFIRRTTLFPFVITFYYSSSLERLRDIVIPCEWTLRRSFHHINAHSYTWSCFRLILLWLTSSSACAVGVWVSEWVKGIMGWQNNLFSRDYLQVYTTAQWCKSSAAFCSFRALGVIESDRELQGITVNDSFVRNFLSRALQLNFCFSC